jgi:hypothetical protein
VVVSTKYLPDIAPLPSLLAPFFAPEESAEQHAESSLKSEPSQSPDRALNRNGLKQPTYVILQNGLAGEKDLYTHFRAQGISVEEKGINILGTAVYIGTNIVNDEIVHNDFVCFSPTDVNYSHTSS